MDREIRIDLAVFQGDSLISRQEYRIRSREPVDEFSICNINHRLTDEGAELVFTRHDNYRMLGGIYLREPFTLRIDAVESKDWISVDMGKFTLTYWCRLGA